MILKTFLVISDWGLVARAFAKQNQ